MVEVACCSAAATTGRPTPTTSLPFCVQSRRRAPTPRARRAAPASSSAAFRSSRRARSVERPSPMPSMPSRRGSASSDLGVGARDARRRRGLGVRGQLWAQQPVKSRRVRVRAPAPAMALDDDECARAPPAVSRRSGTSPHRRQRSIALRCPSCLAAGIVSGTAAGAAEDVRRRRRGRRRAGGPRVSVGAAAAGMRCGASTSATRISGARRPGYGLTIQQGGTALKALGIADAVTAAGRKEPPAREPPSTGSLIGAHARRGDALRAATAPSSRRRSNVHLPRQTLRELLLSTAAAGHRPLGAGRSPRCGRAASTSSSASRASTRRQRRAWSSAPTASASAVRAAAGDDDSAPPLAPLEPSW